MAITSSWEAGLGNVCLNEWSGCRKARSGGLHRCRFIEGHPRACKCGCGAKYRSAYSPDFDDFLKEQLR